MPEAFSKHDPKLEVAPPWIQYPTSERFSIGWRMGGGESYMMQWDGFLRKLGPSHEARLAYFKRYPPAPYAWGDVLYEVLYCCELEGITPTQLNELAMAGLVASDIAYPTWLARQQEMIWPWQHGCNWAPQDMARHATRDFWFWSRQYATLRGSSDWKPTTHPLPDQWQTLTPTLLRGCVESPDLDQGLLTLAQMFAAGQVIPPWQLGLAVSDFADSFDDDMGYVDAFRNWGMSAFDDEIMIKNYLDTFSAPSQWREWAQEQFQPVWYHEDD